MAMYRTTGEQVSIAIIGGGFSGATLAAELLRTSGPSVSIILIERDCCTGRGVAYGTRCARHLLNVRAQNMSALPDDPGHFLHWARHYYDSGTQPGDFLPRRAYAQYIEHVFQQAVSQHARRFERIQDEAVSITHANGRAEILLRDKRRVDADKVVLALGNFPPGDVKLPGKRDRSSRYIANGWSEQALENAAHHESVLLIGSGLTSVDVVLSLRERNLSGTIHMISRHGLLPRHQKERAQWPAFWNAAIPQTARGLLRLVREQVCEAEKQNIDWRAVLDSSRPVTQEIWQSLPLREQRRFLRHVRPYWDVHRHRVAPGIGVLLDSEIERGTLQVHAGRITDYSEHPDFVAVTYRDRESQQLKTLRVDRVINCTGPDADCRRVNNPLLNSLLDQKLVRPDALYLGLDTAENGALLDSDGTASDFLYAVGPLRKGSLWESVAVPEIRVQVVELAAQLITGVERRNKIAIAEEVSAPAIAVG
jgi:uncharacterized NAD(P)/FAD-binding protein YdhS